ncbi:Variant SH3 domain-containing protein [Aphelenchoides fujianensis]|nr:Variant SH3 domain-containing protein [Aphelenchoides fujianensis]
MSELWQQAAEWLHACLQLDPNVRFRSVEEFIAFVKDGQVLCAAANKLSNGCVIQVRRNYNTGTSQFIADSNLTLFLKACRDTFQIPEEDLFQVEDLSDLEDLLKVLKLLSLLSRTPQAEALGLIPFPQGISRRTSHYSLELPDDEAEIYTDLRTRVEPLVEEPPQSTSFDIYGNQHEEEIYNSIIYKRDGPSHQLKKYAEYKPKNKKDHTLKELLDTETNYCDTLRRIVEHFYRPMGMIIGAEDHRAIFLNIDELLVVHRRFLDKLRRAVLLALKLEEETEQDLCVSEVFMIFKCDFLKYTEYCAFLEQSRSKIAEIEVHQPEVRRQVDEYRIRCGQEHVKLSDMLTVPMQRILKYHLLLKQLLDSTPPNDEEMQLLDRAYECMKDVSDFVNEGKRDHEIKGIVREIQGKMANAKQDPDCEFYGRLQQDGPCKVVVSSVSTQQKKRYVFLFDKVLMICKSNRGETGEMKHTFPVCAIRIAENEHEHQLNRSSNTLTRRLTTSLFDTNTLTLRVQDPLQPYCLVQFVFQHMSQRDHWKKAIEAAIDRNSPAVARRYRHDVSYRTYTSPTHCAVCDRLLLGLFYQGYHCRLCKKDVHYKCLGLGNTICPQVATPSLNRSLSNGTTHILMSPQRFDSGERVQAIQAVSSMDSTVLSFQQGDVIEIVKENEDGTMTGCLVKSPSRVGVLSRDSVKRLTRSSSLAGHIPASSSEPDRLSTMGDAVEKPISLVTSARIDLFEEKDHGQIPLDQFPWYFGPMERSDANQTLDETEDGTFLVRHSVAANQYALSVVYHGRPKHIIIGLMAGVPQYYLHGAKLFDTIPELVKYYRRNSLIEGFAEVDIALGGTPLRQKNYRVEHPFVEFPDDSPSFLRLEPGAQVRVLDTRHEQNGWWRGVSRGMTGFFPLGFVEEDDGRVERDVAVF